MKCLLCSLKDTLLSVGVAVGFNQRKKLGLHFRRAILAIMKPRHQDKRRVLLRSWSDLGGVWCGILSQGSHNEKRDKRDKCIGFIHTRKENQLDYEID